MLASDWTGEVRPEAATGNSPLAPEVKVSLLDDVPVLARYPHLSQFIFRAPRIVHSGLAANEKVDGKR